MDTIISYWRYLNFHPKQNISTAIELNMYVCIDGKGQIIHKNTECEWNSNDWNVWMDG